MDRDDWLRHNKDDWLEDHDVPFNKKDYDNEASIVFQDGDMKVMLVVAQCAYCLFRTSGFMRRKMNMVLAKHYRNRHFPITCG